MSYIEEQLDHILGQKIINIKKIILDYSEDLKFNDKDHNFIINNCQNIAKLIDDLSEFNFNKNKNNEQIIKNFVDFCLKIENNKYEIKPQKKQSFAEKLLKYIKEAKKLYDGCKDKLGESCFDHALRVINKLPIGVSKETIIATLFHDVIEDTHYTLDQLKNENSLTFDTAKLIEVLTKPNNCKYETYINKICKEKSLNNNLQIELIIIKLCDMWDNLEITRLKKLDEKTQKRLLNKYLPNVDKLLEFLFKKIQEYHIDINSQYPTLQIMVSSIKCLTNSYKYYEI